MTTRPVTRPVPDCVNCTRYRPGQSRGHYESFFQRANHPSRPLAFWIRYTIFSPHRRPQDALGELWAVYFDGETEQHVALKRVVPFSACRFATSDFFVRVADAQLQAGKLQGSIGSAGHMLSWDLDYAGEEEPLFLLAPRFYRTRFPSAKSVVGLPLAVFNGWLRLDGKLIEIADWVGSQNHNWGSRHTDRYAWGQVAGFDEHPSSFLEVASARLKLGPLWTPTLTLLVLRHQGNEIRLNSLSQSLRASGSFSNSLWTFRSVTDELGVEGTLSAARADFVSLTYSNPPGGVKRCLNSKIASCALKLTRKRAGRPVASETLFTAHRAAFEILTDDTRRPE